MLYNERIKKLQDVLKKAKLDSYLVNNPTDLFYLTGLRLSSGHLWVKSESACLIVDGRYYEACSRKSPVPVKLLSENFLQDFLLEASDIRQIGFDSDCVTYKTYQLLQKQIEEIQKKSLRRSPPTLIPVDHVLLTLRMIKDQEEVKLISQAADLCSKGFDFVLTLLTRGISEWEVARELEIFWKREGGEKMGFDPIIAFGANSSMPHYRAGMSLLEDNQSVLIDIGVGVNGYYSDMTRVVYFGKPDSQFTTIHSIVQQAQQAALSLCHPGTLVGNLDHAARGYIASKGYADYFTHSLGHGVGLDVHELPTIRNHPSVRDVALEPGMVITIEPGIYLPGIGGVRIEDMVVITEDGHKNLTQRSHELLSIPIR